MGTAAPKEGGNHAAEDCPEALLLGAPAACDRDDEVRRHAHVVEGLGPGVEIALGLALLVLMALFRMQTPAVEGFRVLFDVSWGAGPGAFLRLVCQLDDFRRTPCPIWGPKDQGLCGTNKLWVYMLEKEQLSRWDARKPA
jgi:hypothetical protein